MQWGCLKWFCSFWTKLDLTRCIFMKNHTPILIFFGPIMLLIGCILLLIGPFLHCAYGSKFFICQSTRYVLHIFLFHFNFATSFIESYYSFSLPLSFWVLILLYFESFWVENNMYMKSFIGKYCVHLWSHFLQCNVRKSKHKLDNFTWFIW